MTSRFTRTFCKVRFLTWWKYTSGLGPITVAGGNSLLLSGNVVSYEVWIN